MTDHEQADVSIWERLNPEEGFMEEHLQYLEGLGVGELSRMDETFVNSPKERAKNKRKYVEEHLGIDLEEAAQLSGWSEERLERANVAWVEDKANLPVPVAIQILHETISTCHAYLDAPDEDSKARENFLEYLSLGWKARISKRKERENKMSNGKSEYAFRRALGGVSFAGLDRLPEGVLVKTLERLEASLQK